MSSLGQNLLRAEWLVLGDETTAKRERCRLRVRLDLETTAAIGLDHVASDPLYDFARAVGFALPTLRLKDSQAS